MSIADITPGLTPPELARRYRVSSDKVLSWIRTGEIRAVNVSSSSSGRPRWLIPPESIAAFEAKRSSSTPTPTRRTRRNKPRGVVEFF